MTRDKQRFALGVTVLGATAALLLLPLAAEVGAEVKTWRVGDETHPWNITPVSGLIYWGGGWSTEILLDDDGDGLIDEDPVELIDNDDDGLYNEDPPDPQVDTDGDGLLNEDPRDGVDNDGDGRIDEDPPERFDNDDDGLVNEDGPACSDYRWLGSPDPDACDPQVDNDGDGLLNEDGLWTFGDDDYDARWNEDPIGSIDSDGDGLVDEDCREAVDNDGDGLVDEDGPDGVDNDGDGAVDEDGPEVQVDNDGDGLFSEDCGPDDDADGLVDEDRYGPMVDGDDDCLCEPGRSRSLATCDGGTFVHEWGREAGTGGPSAAEEDPIDGLDNDGDGLVDEDDIDSERRTGPAGGRQSAWISPIRAHATRNLVPFFRGREVRKEYGNSNYLSLDEAAFRRESAENFSNTIGGTSYAEFDTYGRAYTLDMDVAHEKKDKETLAVKTFGYYRMTRLIVRPRPAFAKDTPERWILYYGRRGDIINNTMRANRVLERVYSGDTIHEIKERRYDPPVEISALRFYINTPETVRWEVANFSLYADGYVADAAYMSEIMDMGTATVQVRRYPDQWERYGSESELRPYFDDTAPGGQVMWGKVRWRARRLGNGKGDVRIQFRAGDTLDTRKYLRELGPGVYDERDGDGSPMDAWTWAKEPLFKAPVEELPYNELGAPVGFDGPHGWTYWSAPFELDDGLVDTLANGQVDTTRRPLREQGIDLPLPPQTRYLQFRIYFDSDAYGAVAFDWMEFEYDSAPVVGDGMVAEVSPPFAPIGTPQEFRYVMKPTFTTGASEGFNRLAISVPSANARVTNLLVDTVPWEEIAAAEVGDDPLGGVEPEFITDERGEFAQAVTTDPATGRHELQIKVPNLNPAALPALDPSLGAGGATIEVTFSATMYRGANRFQGWVWSDRAQAGTFVRQPVTPGNATEELSTNDLNVVAEEIDQLLGKPQVAPNPFTPNADGTNDTAVFSFDLLLITGVIDLSVDIHDLSGRVVRRLESSHTAGRIQVEWDGTDASGDLVPPGVYLYRVSADDDEDFEDRLGYVAVAY